MVNSLVQVRKGRPTTPAKSPMSISLGAAASSPRRPLM
jgi:hypothetical protein